jgi:hypothetical protein
MATAGVWPRGGSVPGGDSRKGTALICPDLLRLASRARRDLPPGSVRFVDRASRTGQHGQVIYASGLNVVVAADDIEACRSPLVGRVTR